MNAPVECVVSVLFSALRRAIPLSASPEKLWYSMKPLSLYPVTLEFVRVMAFLPSTTPISLLLATPFTLLAVILPVE